MKNPGWFWSHAHEKLLFFFPPLFWNMKTWLCSRGGNEAAWLSPSDIIPVSATARKFLTITTSCFKVFFFALLFHPSNKIIPSAGCCLLDDSVCMSRSCSSCLRCMEWSGFAGIVELFGCRLAFINDPNPVSCLSSSTSVPLLFFEWCYSRILESFPRNKTPKSQGTLFSWSSCLNYMEWSSLLELWNYLGADWPL